MRSCYWILGAISLPIALGACGSSGEDLFESSGSPATGGASGGGNAGTGGESGSSGGTTGGGTGGSSAGTGGSAGDSGNGGTTGGSGGSVGGTGGETGGSGGNVGGTGGNVGGTGGETGGTGGNVGGTGGNVGGTGGETGGTGGMPGGSGGGPGGTGGQPTCTPVGHDEDGDGIDDACDNCPSIPNAPQANIDGDAIGNQCEDTGNPGLLSLIPYFEPWTTDQWQSTWWFDDEYEPDFDIVHVDDGDCVSYCGEDALWQSNLAANKYSVEASMTFQAYSYGYAGVVFGFDESTYEFWTCLFHRDNDRGLGLWHYPGNSSTTINNVTNVSNVEPNNTGSDTLRWVRAYRDGNALFCEFTNENGDVARTPPFQGTGSMSGLAGLRVYAAHAHFRSFTVYR